MMKGKISLIEYKEALEFLLPKHYSGRKPQITYAFGWYVDDMLVAVCTFGKPASPQLCYGLCGKEHSHRVYELNRLCRIEEITEPISYFVSACLRRLSGDDLVIVSYADRGMHHSGYVYQACNFIYTGYTQKRTDKWTEGNKHSRHYSNNDQGEYRKVRTSKHRYVYFCTRNKNLKTVLKKSLKYNIQPYPKEENKNYTLGKFQEPMLVKSTTIYKK